MAGFNHRARSTGIVAFTASVHGGNGSRFAPAELYRHEGGDLLWIGINRPRFIVWGETCRFASLIYGYAGALGDRRPYCSIATREEFANEQTL